VKCVLSIHKKIDGHISPHFSRDNVCICTAIYDETLSHRGDIAIKHGSFRIFVSDFENPRTSSSLTLYTQPLIYLDTRLVRLTSQFDRDIVVVLRVGDILEKEREREKT
jgi:hypothetical protein